MFDIDNAVNSEISNDNTEIISNDDIVSKKDNLNKSSKKKYEWKKEQEDILKVWADKALCYKTMHDRSAKKYWCLNAWFNIPIIIISTLTGTGNLAQNSFKPEYASYLIVIIGIANIVSGILGTIAQYINVAGILEGHKFASVSWDKYAREISVELRKVRSDRQDPGPFIMRCQENFDRLIEISPNFSNDIIEWFNNLINTGEYIDDNHFFGICCYEWFCLPCGFRGCKNSKCCKNNKDLEDINKNRFKSEWDNIELPEILGRIKPTKITRSETDRNNNKYRVNNFIDV